MFQLRNRHTEPASREKKRNSNAGNSRLGNSRGGNQNSQQIDLLESIASLRADIHAQGERISAYLDEALKLLRQVASR